MSHGQIVLSQRVRLRSTIRNSSANGIQGSIEYFVRKPRPTTTPVRSHAQRLPSMIVFTARHVANAQKKKNGGSIVMSVPPAVYIGTIPPIRNAPKARRSLRKSLRVSQ